MKPLSKGDTCKVRLHTGEVVEAEYHSPSPGIGCRIYHNGKEYIALSRYHAKSRKSIENYNPWECRFVGNPCDLVPVGGEGMSDKKQYSERDIIGLDEKGGYCFRHVDAMTGERIHSKSDIAAELGYRDMLIDTYRQLCADLLMHLKS